MVSICMVVHKSYYHDTRVRRYAESLVEQGVSVDVVCPWEEYAVVQEHQNIRVYPIPIHHIPKSRLNYFVEYGLAFIFYFLRISVLYFKNHYPIIHIHNMPDILVFSALIPKMMGAQLILDIHDPMPEVFLSKYGEREGRFILKFVRWQEGVSCALANAVITANSNFKENLIERGIPAEKITVINNFPNLLIFNRMAVMRQIPPSDHTFTLIYPGTIARRYGLDIAICAMPKLKSKIPGIRLVIMGQENDCKNELRRLAKRLDVAECVQFKPVVRNEEVPLAMVSAEAGIYPARRDPHMNIATPTKVLEFATMGIPIISSRLKVVETMFDDSSALFFEPNNVDQFVNCVLRLYEEPALCKELVHNADRKFVETHSWEMEFQSYQRVLNGLLPDRIFTRGVHGA